MKTTELKKKSNDSAVKPIWKHIMYMNLLICVSISQL